MSLYGKGLTTGDGQVANRPIFPPQAGGTPAAISASLDGRRDVLGLWAGTGREGAKFFDVRADRHSQSRHSGCLLPGLRRIERPAGSHPVNDGRNLVHSRRTETRPRRCIHCAALSALTDGNVSIPVFLSR